MKDQKKRLSLETLLAGAYDLLRHKLFPQQKKYQIDDTKLFMSQLCCTSD